MLWSMKSRSPGASHEIWWLSGRGMKSGSTPLPVCRNSVLFDNSLNDNAFDWHPWRTVKRGLHTGARYQKRFMGAPSIMLGLMSPSQCAKPVEPPLHAQEWAGLILTPLILNPAYILGLASLLPSEEI
jgi:hypothetical protein